MFADFSLIIYWWAIILFLGILFFPITIKFFSQFWDKGWVFSKTIGLLITSYIVFILARFRWARFSGPTIALALLILPVAVVWRRRKNGLKQIKKITGAKAFVFEEFIFALAFFSWSFIRGFAPRIEGLEKFMDFGFLNSILRSSRFPPQDMWFSGSSINYYYFGHLQSAVLVKMSGFDPAVAYNLLIATIFALVFTSAFSLSSNLVFLFFKDKKPFKGGLPRMAIGGGFISAFLLSLGANLHPAIYAFKNGVSKYWYPDATRFIGYNPNNPYDKTIHEFPSYSFVVADLHGHMNDLPTVLLFLAFLVAFGLIMAAKKRNQKEVFLRLLFFSFLLAVMYMTNSWDLPIYGLLLAIYIGFSFFFSFSGPFFQKCIFAFRKVFLLGLLVLAGSVVISLPFSLSFKPMAQGIDFVHAHTLWWQFFVLWGFFWFLAASFWLFFLFAIKNEKEIANIDIFVFSLTIWATILIFIPEIAYVKDIYTASYHRANTMFKLVYQSFTIYAICAGYIFLRIYQKLTAKTKRGFIFSLLFLAGFSAQMIYPYFAIKGYYGKITPGRYKGLFGMNFLKNNHLDDYRGILWLNKNVKGQPVVLEAAGDSYTLYGRVSAMTGLPTVEGWLVHEWLWRGEYTIPFRRQKEVKMVFEGKDDAVARYILKKYNVKYVFIGDLERKKYPQLNLARFEKWGRRVFSAGKTGIYRLN